MLFTPMSRELRPVSAASGRVGTLLGWGLRFGDALAILLAGIAAYAFRFGTADVDVLYQRHIAHGVLFALLVLTVMPLYRSWRGRGLAAELWTMFVGFTAVFALGLIYDVALKLSGEISRLWILAWFGTTILFATGLRLVVRRTAEWAREQGFDVRSAVIVGGRSDATRVVSELARHPGAGIRMLGWFESTDPDEATAASTRLGGLADLAAYVETNAVQQVWIVLPLSEQAKIHRILEQLAHSTAEIKFVPDILGLQLINHSVEQVAGLPVINLRANPFDADAQLLKAVEDYVLASLILVLIAPLLALIAVGVKLSSPGPVLYRQARHGLDGKIIQVWKFRSMRVHAEERGQVTQAKRGDLRVTRFGAFLRRTSLDELPQFINVLQGTMSIVGPRPHAVQHNHHYKVLVQDYMQRHRVKPGITGWAQVNGLRGETDTVDKMAARVECDLYYMSRWSLWLDLKIVGLTIFKGFFGKNAY